MWLGPDNALWSQLFKELSSLSDRCRGEFAFVIDTGNGLWCVGRSEGWPFEPVAQNEAADRFYDNELLPRVPSMRRGVPFEVARVLGSDRYFAASFAGTYAVAVWFIGKPLRADHVRNEVRVALPKIEALTLALPPAPGPGHDSGAMKFRA